MALDLFVIAGPNGAGKSIFSNTLVQIEFKVFDGDQYISQLKQKYPEVGSDILQDHVNVNEYEFKEAKEMAIKAKKSFAFETNFSSSNPIKSLTEFKLSGYRTHLIFMGMNTIEDCIQRVSLRVKSGGHKVSEESIVYNFEHGYANLFSYYHAFDTVTLFDNTIALTESIRIPVKILFWENGNIQLHTQQYPEWVKEFITINSI
jgi:predicted ABC-type ATPase